MPPIQIAEGELANIVQELGERLAAARAPYYRRGTLLARAMRILERTEQGESSAQ